MPTRIPNRSPVPSSQPIPPLPHERDEMTETAVDPPRGTMRRALRDLEEGQEDTDLRGTQGRRIPQRVRKAGTKVERGVKRKGG